MNSQDFPYFSTLIAAFIGAIIGQLSILFFNWVKKKRDLNKKKKLIISDLNSQEIVLFRMETHLCELKKRFEISEKGSYTGDAFQDLTKDVYESVSKLDLFEIFDQNLIILIDIYESIVFLKTNRDCKEFCVSK